MTRRREAISAQLGSLREMMAGFGDDEKPDAKPDAKPDGKSGARSGAKSKGKS
jgi:hypothetical protein